MSLILDKVLTSTIFTIFLFCLFWGLSEVAKRVINQIGKRKNVRTGFLEFLAKAVSWTILALGIITILGSFGINLSGLITSLGLTGFALGLALKDVVSNAVSGMLLLAFRCFEEGSFIEIGSSKGFVSHVDLRYTVLDSEDEEQAIYIPNSILFNQTIIVHHRQQKVIAASVNTTSDQHSADGGT